MENGEARTDVAMPLQLGSIIGQGTSGVVSELLNAIDGGRYVIKTVQLDRSQDARLALQEVRIHRIVSEGCSCVVRYAFATLAGERLLVCMEACDVILWDVLNATGESRRDFSVGGLARGGLAREGEQWTQKMAISEELCSAVQHCHQRLVIHRDVNPWNVFLTRRHGQGPELAAKLGDFGLAVLLPDGAAELTGIEAEDAVPLDESAMGSLYSAPELGQRYGFAADVFSTGMTLLALWSAASCDNEEALITITERAKAGESCEAGVLSGAGAACLPLLRSMLSSRPSDRPHAPAVCATLTRLCEESAAKRGLRSGVDQCFRNYFGERRLVTWDQLSRVLAFCAPDDASLQALRNVWGQDVDGVLDYTHFLDWIFQQGDVREARGKSLD